MDWQPLVEAAQRARQRAYAPHSGYRVGAALLTTDGDIFAASNVENWLLALTICAERAAVTAAVNAGQRKFRALAVVTDSRPPTCPCGLCRQTLVEFVKAGDDLPVLCVNETGERIETSLAALLPRAFRLDEARRRDDG